MLIEPVHVEAAFGDDCQVLYLIANIANHAASHEELALQIR